LSDVYVIQQSNFPPKFIFKFALITTTLKRPSEYRFTRYCQKI